jgi:N-formylglutamate amidohydrolase
MRRVHALQIEIDRALYMDEARVEKRPDFDEIRRRVGRAVVELTRLGGARLPMAAE